MTTTFTIENARRDVRPYWWVEIEGIQKRFGLLRDGQDTVFDGWNPADTGTNQHIFPWLARVPKIGGQSIDPLNGKTSVQNISFCIYDKDGALTALLAVSDTPKKLTYLTKEHNKTETSITVVDASEFSSGGGIAYINRETISYTGTTTGTTSSGTVGNNLTGQATDGNRISIEDNNASSPLNSAAYDEDFWAGGYVEMTSGTCNGEKKRITRSVYQAPESGEAINTLYIDPADPFTDTIDALDTYVITPPPHRVYDPDPPFSDSFVGRTFQITADSTNPANVGQVRYVKSRSGDFLEFHEPFPLPLENGATYSTYLEKLTGVTRGIWGSEAAIHKVTDQYNSLAAVTVSDSPRFFKGRKFWIYENRTGCLEAQAIVCRGVIDNINLDRDAKSYTFSGSSLIKTLSKKLCSKQEKHVIAFHPVWGGLFRYPRNEVRYDNTSGNFIITEQNHFEIGKAAPCMADANETFFCVTEMFVKSPAKPSKNMNVIANGEVMHVTRDGMKRHFSNGSITGVEDVFCWRLAFSAQEILWHTSADNNDFAYDLTAATLGLQNRGLFAEKIGLSEQQHQSRTELMGNSDGAIPPWPAASAFAREHMVGDEVKRVILCDNSTMTDFPRYDRIYYTNLSGTFSVGNKANGQLSGAYGIVMAIGSDGTGDYYDIIRTPHDESSNETEFDAANGESFTNGSGATANVASYNPGHHQRNNVINVMLQLMMSSGVVGTNGKYDTLPDGFGIGLTTDDVDVASFELIRDRFFARSGIDFVIHEPTPAIEWITKNILKLLQLNLYESTTGKFALCYLYTENEAQDLDTETTLTVIDDDKLEAAVIPSWDSGRDLVSQVKVKYNRDPGGSDYLSTMIVNFNDGFLLSDGIGRSIEFECDVLYYPERRLSNMDHLDPDMPEIVSRLINPMWSRHSIYPAPAVKCRLPFSSRVLVPGQVVKFTEPSLPNLRTGLRGLTGEYFQIVSVKPDTNRGDCEIEMWQIGIHDNKTARKSPSALIATYTADTPSAGKSTITVNSTAFGIPSGGTSPAGFFAVGDECMFLSAAYNRLGGAAPERFTIETVTQATHTIVLDANATFAPSAGCFLELASYDYVTATRQSTRAFMADENSLLGTADATAFKYR